MWAALEASTSNREVPRARQEQLVFNVPCPEVLRGWQQLSRTPWELCLWELEAEEEQSLPNYGLRGKAGVVGLNTVWPLSQPPTDKTQSKWYSLQRPNFWAQSQIEKRVSLEGIDEIFLLNWKCGLITLKLKIQWNWTENVTQLNSTTDYQLHNGDEEQSINEQLRLEPNINWQIQSYAQSILCSFIHPFSHLFVCSR